MEERRLVMRKMIAFTAVYSFNFLGYIGLIRGLPFWYISQSKPVWAIPYYSFGVVTILLCAPLAWATIKIVQSENRKPLYVLGSAQMLGWCFWEWGLFAFHNIILVNIGIFICFAASFALFAVYRKWSLAVAIAFQIAVLWCIYGFALAVAIAHLNNHT